jgi:hypothetical protein
MTRLLLFGLTALLAVPAFSSQDRLTDTEKIELVRNLTAEYAITKETLPRSKKPLDFDASGKYDQPKWAALIRDNGPAARLGDQVQITKLVIEKERILFEINGGNKNNSHWYDHVQVGMGGPNGGGMSPVGHGNATATTGTIIALDFHQPIGELDSTEIKKLLQPLFDFDKHSATKLYSETLPPEIRKAIADKRAQAGMDRDQVLLALGHPDRKVRETKDGDELEDWIYGHPPGKITFVTFNGSKVVNVKESYAQLGAEQANPIESPR